MKKYQKGFTLIELLVVIAVVAILSSVVWAFMGSARNRTADTAVKAGMKELVAQALLYSNETNGSYGPVGGTPKPCMQNTSFSGVFSNTKVKSIVSNVLSNSANKAPYNFAMCVENNNSFAMYVPLKGGGFWCVDNSNHSTSTNIISPNINYVESGAVWTCR